MRSSVYGWASLSLVLLHAGCTFYTACPAGNGNGNAPTGTAGTDNAGGANDVGGTMNNGGGSGGTGGTGALPLPEGTWVTATSNLAHQPSECGNLSFATAKPDEDLILMGVAQHGLWGSRDGGDSWEQLGSKDDPEPITNRVTYVVFDPDDTDTFWESGIYNATGIFKTTDDGATFSPMHITHNDFVSVDFTDPKRKTLLASGHEQIHKLYLSEDGAETWNEIGDFIP